MNLHPSNLLPLILAFEAGEIDSLEDIIALGHLAEQAGLHRSQGTYSRLVRDLHAAGHLPIKQDAIDTESLVSWVSAQVDPTDPPGPETWRSMGGVEIGLVYDPSESAWCVQISNDYTIHHTLAEAVKHIDNNSNLSQAPAIVQALHTANHSPLMAEVLRAGLWSWFYFKAHGQEPGRSVLGWDDEREAFVYLEDDEPLFETPNLTTLAQWYIAGRADGELFGLPTDVHLALYRLDE